MMATGGGWIVEVDIRKFFDAIDRGHLREFVKRRVRDGVQHTLSQKLRGHFAYYGITGNGHTLSEFQSGVVELWRKWLGRRHRGGEVTWERMHRLLERYPLPQASVVHSVYRRAAKV
jgi:hypothetical protein